MQTATQYTVQHFDPQADRDTILDLWRRNLPEASPSRYQWLYGRDRASGWLLRSETDEVVGSTGIMERRMQIGGSQFMVGQAIDLNVNADHRSLGPALELQRAVVRTVEQSRYHLMYGFPNERSERMLIHLGYRTLGSVERWAKLLRSEGRLERYVRPKLVRKLIGRAVDFALRLACDELSSQAWADLQFADSVGFDARFDALWQDGRRKYYIAGDRSSRYLNWRFGRCPDLPHHVFTMSRAGKNDLLAYLIYSRRGDIVNMDDFFAADHAYFYPLLAAFVRLTRRTDAEAILTSYIGPAAIGQSLAKLGFWRRETPSQAIVYLDESQWSQPDRVLDRSNWLLTTADADTDA
jgi:hypothetical protein